MTSCYALSVKNTQNAVFKQLVHTVDSMSYLPLQHVYVIVVLFDYACFDNFDI
jgi:hypothetical protein